MFITKQTETWIKTLLQEIKSYRFFSSNVDRVRGMDRDVRLRIKKTKKSSSD
uniref:Uncharacterized protein n=1 Tax=Arion vulgaris TaxID=1028688 RepID=A0A0B6ZZI7_9EUPU